MTIKAGERLPAGTLWEFIEEETPGCSVGPNSFDVQQQLQGKRVAIFGLPGAFTPTCSAKHLPGFVANAEKLKAKGIQEIWCLSVNDPFVMGAWGRDQGAKGKVRMMADGSGLYTKALGLELDLVQRGLGVRASDRRPVCRWPLLRCARFSMLVDNGTVKALNIEEPGKFEVSSAEKMLEQMEKGTFFLP